MNIIKKAGRSKFRVRWVILCVIMIPQGGGDAGIAF